MIFRSPDEVRRSQARQGQPPGHSGLLRVHRAAINSIRGFRHGLATERAIKQEALIAIAGGALAVPVASSLLEWVALFGSLLLILCVESMNTALERLCDHVTPEHHEAIGVTKDLGSAAVFFSIILAGLIWCAALITAILNH